MPWREGLEGAQLAIAAEPGNPVHVLAGPGTGKTLAMMRRVARLLAEGMDPQEILAVSFTRTAARDLKEQLRRLGVGGADQVTATTLHSLCFSALLEDAVFQATGRRPRPLLSYEIDQLTTDLKKQFGGKREVAKLLEAYEAAWARLQHEVAGAPQQQRDIDFEAALLDWLRYHRAMLIGELVPIALRFLQANPHAGVLPAYRAVLVDEYQDLNKADQTLVDVLGTNASLTIVGDDNQSIYRFRHANPDGIRVFPDDHPGTCSHTIEECRRCPPNIVTMSNALLGHDPLARQTPLRSQAGRAAASVYVVQHPSIGDEADTIAAYVDDYLNRRNGLPPGQVLILSPRRIFGNAIRDALIRRRRNALSFFWEDALDAVSAAEGFCLLTLLVSPEDRAAYRAWLGLGDVDGNRAGYARIRGHAEEHGIEPFDVCERLARDEIEVRYSRKVLAKHDELKGRLAALAGLQGTPLVNALWDPADPETLTIRLAAGAVAADNPEPTNLYQRLVEVITQPELPDSAGDVIRIMSLHKAKGLTAELVVIAGCVGGAIPTVDTELTPAGQDLELREQRRLFYVAVTRPKDTLVLSSVTQMPLAQALRANIPPLQVRRSSGETYARLAASPFIAELGATCPHAIRGSDWRVALNF